MPIFSSVCYINGVKNRNEATKMVIFNLFCIKIQFYYSKIFIHYLCKKIKMPMSQPNQGCGIGILKLLLCEWLIKFLALQKMRHYCNCDKIRIK